MDTVSLIQKAIDFIEGNILNDLKLEVVASQAYMSSFHFQRIFSIVCNITIGEYIRSRRLTLAGIEITSSNVKIIDVAFKYGYESPESFSRAFTRFHGISPLAARSHEGKIHSFTKISVQSILGGKGTMQDLKQRGYSISESGSVYYTKDMEKTVKWFEEVLGWYGGIDEGNENGNGVYGCVLPIPHELIDMKMVTFNGIHLFYGEPLKQVVTFMRVDHIDNLYSYVKQHGWNEITEIETKQWGSKECSVKTIDGSIMIFFQID